MHQMASPLRYFYDLTQRDPASSGCALLSAERVKQGADEILSQTAGWGG
jgi:hypothetical protein